MTLATPGFIDDIMDSHASKRAIHNFINRTDSEFINELVDIDNENVFLPQSTNKRASSLEAPALQAITNAVDIINKHDPTLVSIFKSFILELAMNTALSKSAMTKQEQTSYQKVAQALEATPELISTAWSPDRPLDK